MKSKIRNLKSKIFNFIKNNKTEVMILGIIILLGAFFRLYKISDYMAFLGDEGRDVIIVRRIFTEAHPPLIGPGTSVGSMYLGPLYYYLMAIPLLIAGFSPIGPAVMVALLGVATIAFIWWVGRVWFNKKAGIIAAAFYAIAPTVIIYSRSSWNPNIMPFFALLSVYSIWKAWKCKSYNWLVVMGVSFAFVLQSHYLGFLLAPTLFVFWIIALVASQKNNSKKRFVAKSILGIAVFLILMSPLLIFDIRHNFINANAFYNFLTQGNSSFSFNVEQIFSKIASVTNTIVKSLITAKMNISAIILSISIFIFALISIISTKLSKTKVKSEYWIVAAWLLFGLIGFAIYKQNIYDHYFGFLFPVIFLIVGIIFSKIIAGKMLLKIIGVMAMVYLLIVNLVNSPLRKDPNRLLQRSIRVSKVVEKESQGAPFNLAVIADTNYEDGYKYFLLKDNFPVVDIDAQKPETVTNQLFVVCELIPVTKCDPTHSPKAQVASFGWSKIEGSWEVDGAMVYKLIHSQ